MWRSVIAGLASIAIAVALVGGGVGEVLRHPALRSVGLPPPDLPAKSIVLRTPRNQPVAGWMVGGKPGEGVVVLLHGVRGDRREMIGRAKFLNRLGYSVLLIDLPAHGESAAEHITYGWNESEGVKTALDYLSHEFPDERVGVIGVSLGAASLVLSDPSPAPSAVVLESMFPTITEAVSDRVRLYLGPLAKPLALLLVATPSASWCIARTVAADRSAVLIAFAGAHRFWFDRSAHHSLRDKAVVRCGRSAKGALDSRRGCPC